MMDTVELMLTYDDSKLSFITDLRYEETKCPILRRFRGDRNSVQRLAELHSDSLSTSSRLELC